MTDHLGDTTRVYGTNGEYYGAIPDDLPNEDHFVNEDLPIPNFNKIAENLEDKKYNKAAELLRSSSEYYIGANTRTQLKEVAEIAETNGKNLERGFILQKNKETRELQVLDVSDFGIYDDTNTATSVEFGKAYRTSWKKGSDNFIMHGHTHGIYSIKALGRDVKKDYVPSVLNAPSSTKGLQDYDDIVFENYTGHPSIVATPLGYTIYATAVKNLGFGNKDYRLKNKGQVYDYSNGEMLHNFQK